MIVPYITLSTGCVILHHQKVIENIFTLNNFALCVCLAINIIMVFACS